MEKKLTVELGQDGSVLVVRNGAKASVAMQIGVPEPGKTKLELGACVGLVHWMVKQLRPVTAGVTTEGLLQAGIKDAFHRIGRPALKTEVVSIVDAPQSLDWRTKVEETFDAMLADGSVIEDGVRERIGALYKLAE